jgi:hypothetical protein
LQLDPEYLRQYYASLSDQALREVDRNDLVEMAQLCYDREVAQRKRSAPHETLPTGRSRAGPSPKSAEAIGEDRDRPDWLEEGSEVYSMYVRPGSPDAGGAEDALAALEAEGIPCHLEAREDPPEENVIRAPRQRWVLLVPGELNLHAASVLDRDIFNVEFEGVWRNHLQVLSDEEVLAANPEVVFCGLYDRIDRITRAYREELSSRGLAAS